MVLMVRKESSKSSNLDPSKFRNLEIKATHVFSTTRLVSDISNISLMRVRVRLEGSLEGGQRKGSLRGRAAYLNPICAWAYLP